MAKATTKKLTRKQFSREMVSFLDGLRRTVEAACAAFPVYQTTAAITLAGTGEAVTASAPCEAVQAGALPDAVGVQVTLLSAPSGVQAKALLDLEGGTDAETNASMLTTLLDYMRNPPAGGTAADYRRWARSVPGVADATVYPLRQGPGTVDIVIVGEDGILGVDVVAACQTKIDAERPCTAKAAKVYAPVCQVACKSVPTCAPAYSCANLFSS